MGVLFCKRDTQSVCMVYVILSDFNDKMNNVIYHVFMSLVLVFKMTKCIACVAFVAIQVYNNNSFVRLTAWIMTLFGLAERPNEISRSYQLFPMSLLLFLSLLIRRTKKWNLLSSLVFIVLFVVVLVCLVTIQLQKV